MTGKTVLIYSGLREHLLDIRGYRPSPEELEWAAQNPDAMTDILDSWLSEPAFANQMAWYWNDLFHTVVVDWTRRAI